MDQPSVRKQITEAWAELYMAETAQRKIEQRVHDLRELIKATANFLPPKERRTELLVLEVAKHPSNIAEAVRLVLFLQQPEYVPLTPVEIRDKAEARGFSFAEYTNPLASIHTILRRMKEANPPEVRYDEKTGGYVLDHKSASGLVNPDWGKKVQDALWRKTARRFIEHHPFDVSQFQTMMNSIKEQVLKEELDKAEGKRSEDEFESDAEELEKKPD